MEAGIVSSPPASRLRRLGPALSDAQLVARVRRGDERAFEVVFDRFHAQLLSFCRHMLGNREEAEDALQHVFVSAHRHLVAGERSIELRPWLYAIARNRCLSVLRARRESVALDDVAEPSTAGLAVAAEVERREDLQELLADLARLPDEQRAALVLSELDALSHDEIAEVLGVRRDKVKALVFQAREALAGWRQARHANCGEIREQLATLRGAALRRGALRKHLETCAGCREFRDEVRHQREAMAVLLPVLPSIALKAKIAGAIAAGHAAGAGAATVGAGALGGGLSAAAASPAASGSAVALGGGLVAKAAAVVAVAAVAGGGYAAVQRTSHHAAPASHGAARSVSATPGATSSGAASVTGSATPVAGAPAGGADATPGGSAGSHASATGRHHRAGRHHGAQAHGPAGGLDSIPGARPAIRGSGHSAAKHATKAHGHGATGHGKGATAAPHKAKVHHHAVRRTSRVPAHPAHPVHPVTHKSSDATTTTAPDTEPTTTTTDDDQTATGRSDKSPALSLPKLHPRISTP